ncbi:MAG TPA: hypothetical protein DF774_03880 [Rheinheimera sp.]|nr:hypothetical protein [Rheinheimera sp.]
MIGVFAVLTGVSNYLSCKSALNLIFKTQPVFHFVAWNKLPHTVFGIKKLLVPLLLPMFEQPADGKITGSRVVVVAENNG